jgi:glyoxylase-like metal-dependent hydrolase (beta-lactamase superfamily II)
MQIQHFFDPETFTLSYVVWDSLSKDAVVIDPVLDFDPPSGTVSNRAIKPVIQYLQEHKLTLHAILETHAHADHLSSSQILKQVFPHAKIAISDKIKLVQEVFIQHFNIDYLTADGSQFDLLLKPNQEINFGSLKMKALATPGHTPACMSFLFGQHLFTGDALFMPDYGTGRCDFPKGSARDLYLSITKNLYTLPDSTQIYVGHDYSPNGREMKFQSTIGESKKNNIQLKTGTTEVEYVAFRETRDKTLKAPRLLLPSIQVNIDAGHLPPQESNGEAYLKLPLVKKFD